jgi:hypothetical protein
MFNNAQLNCVINKEQAMAVRPSPALTLLVHCMTNFSFSRHVLIVKRFVALTGHKLYRQNFGQSSNHKNNSPGEIY